MRKFLFVCLVTAHPAFSADCATIIDNDQRHYCRAITSGNIGECAVIRDRDLRIACQSEVSKDPARCASIMDLQARALCQVRAEGQ